MSWLYIFHLSPQILILWTFMHLRAKTRGNLKSAIIPIQHNLYLHLFWSSSKFSVLFCIVISDLFEIKINLLILGGAKLEITLEQYRSFWLFYWFLTVIWLFYDLNTFNYACVLLFAHSFWICEVDGWSKAEMYSWTDLVLFQL